MVSGQSKMDRNTNPHHHYVPLYCSQFTQTQPESDYDAESESESSDFSPIRTGKRMSPGSAMHRNPPQHPQHNTGLGRTNILNMIDATASVQHGKVTVTSTYSRMFILIRPSPCQSEALELKTLSMSAY